MQVFEAFYVPKIIVVRQSLGVGGKAVFCYDWIMLTEGQQNFLNSLKPEELNRIVKIEPWGPRGFEFANQLVNQIKQAVPKLEVQLMGSVYFKIAGERDIDITIYCPKSDHAKYTPIIEKLFGKHTSEGKNHIGWAFDKDDYHVTVFLSDLASPNAQLQKQFFGLLKDRPDLVKEYEQIKLAMDGKTYKDYQIAKYNFYNRVLEL